MNSYTKIESIHVHNTRQVENITFYKPSINKSIKKIYSYTEQTVYGMK